jgi:hypothetical protein
MNLRERDPRRQHYANSLFEGAQNTADSMTGNSSICNSGGLSKDRTGGRYQTN